MPHKSKRKLRFKAKRPATPTSPALKMAAEGMAVVVTGATATETATATTSQPTTPSPKNKNPKSKPEKTSTELSTKKVNTKTAKFTPLRKFGNTAKADSITVTCNKGENKIKVQAVMVMSDLAKNKTTIRKESTIVDEIHNLPPFIKNKDLFGKIEAKFYKGQGVILNLPERPRNNRNKDNKDNKNNKEENDEDHKSDEEVAANTNDEDNQRKYQEVDISHVLETVVDLEIKFE